MNYKCNIDDIFEPMNRILNEWFEFSYRLLVMSWPNTAFQLVFCKFELEILQVGMGVYHIERWFILVRYQIPHCYLCSKSRNNMEKWNFEHFTANSYLSFNKKDSVALVAIIRIIHALKHNLEFCLEIKHFNVKLTLLM